MKEGRSAARMRRLSSMPKARDVPSAAMAVMGAMKGARTAGAASLGISSFIVYRITERSSTARCKKERRKGNASR